MAEFSHIAQPDTTAAGLPARAAWPQREEPRHSKPAVPTAAPADGADLQGLSLVAAAATISSGPSLVADYVMGPDDRLAQIRVIDPTTHQVIAESPPDSIAHMRQEIMDYQGIARQSRPARGA